MDQGIVLDSTQGLIKEFDFLYYDIVLFVTVVCQRTVTEGKIHLMIGWAMAHLAHPPKPAFIIHHQMAEIKSL